MFVFKCDTSQFNGIGTDLALVKPYLAIQSTWNAKNAALDRIRELRLSESKSATSIVRAVKEEFEAAQQRSQSEESRLAELKNRLNVVRGRLSSGSNTKPYLMGIASMYLTIDWEQLMSDMDLVDSREVSKTEEIAALEDQVGELDKFLAARWDDVSEVVNFVPKWVNNLYGSTIPPVEAFVTNFFNTWRDRAKLFNVPVTIYGTDISTLNPDTQKVWADAYQALGFDSLPKTPRFDPVPAPKAR